MSRSEHPTGLGKDSASRSKDSESRSEHSKSPSEQSSSPAERPRVLAVGIDAAEPGFVRGLIDVGELPTLARLLEAGEWGRVESPARVGSGTVWPTFFTGTGPSAHGVYSEWRWRPETMSLAPYEPSRLAPFWRRLARDGVRVGVLDVPFAPFVGLSEGFEIGEWGAHDRLDGETKAAPREIDELVNEFTPHPFSSERNGARGEGDAAGLSRLAAACVEGARLRGELAARLIKETRTDFSLVVFPELHHAAHKLWRTVAPEHPLYSRGGPPEANAVSPTLADILREVDAQVARLVEAAGPDASVLVFSLHGMRPARGLPDFLAPLLCELGLSREAGFATLSWAQRTSMLFAAAKRRAPAPLKRLYHRRLPPGVSRRLARPTMLPSYDWTRTRAFALPTDQHGWIRVNLVGREAAGCVPPERYEEVCAEVEEALRALMTEDGRPLVRDVLRTAEGPREALTQLLPDLVVHWHDSAFDLPARVGSLTLHAHPAARGQTGQHAPEGFCVWKGPRALAAETIFAGELHLLITEALAGR
jgi:predicted AlkP superfamily phosphohydrolase/phosphomutase